MRAFYADKSVLVTGHTGFKGGWLGLWLEALGSRAFGYALAPPSTPSLFDMAKVGKHVDDARGDVRDLERLAARVKAVKPDVVFHLAAQPIVRASYDNPVETFTTNITGTVNLLEAVRVAGRPCTVIIVTTDKVYEETAGYACRETDPLGGPDPYSASKAAAEIVTSSYARSFFDEKSGIRVASARAGNVIGGGDFAADRLVPDLVRGVEKKEKLRLRNPYSVRPWQHVLEPLSGYLWLGAKVGQGTFGEFGGGWNFGPSSDSFRTVLDLATRAAKAFEHEIEIGEPDEARHELPSLTLTTDKARRKLGWAPVWQIDQAIDETMAWYSSVHGGADAEAQTLRQIAKYEADAKALAMPWGQS